jgi:hypothetical protein
MVDGGWRKRRARKRRLFPNWVGNKGETSGAPFQESEI